MNSKSLLDRSRFILPDNCSLKLYVSPARGKCKGILLFAHGMLEYAGRYCDWGERISELGYTWIAVDHRGHGRSDGSKIWMNHLDEIVDDFEKFVGKALEEFSPLPVFLVGMSMGGGIVLRTAARFQDKKDGPSLSGVILVAPALKAHPRIMPPFLKYFINPVDRLFPRWKILHGTCVGLCHDKEIIQKFCEDPCVHQGGFAIHYGVENVRALPGNRSLALKLTLPILALQGEGDKITDPSGPKEFIDRSISPDKTLKLYPGLYHDLLHEPQKEEITKDILQWLDRLSETKQ